jgi:hypothetical protein
MVGDMEIKKYLLISAYPHISLLTHPPITLGRQNAGVHQCRLKSRRSFPV